MVAPYFSPLRRALERLMMESASPQQWLGTLSNMAKRGEFRTAELGDSGLENFLRGHEQQATPTLMRGALLEHMNQAPEFDEVLFGGPPRARVTNTEEPVVEERDYDYPDRESAISALEEDYSHRISEHAEHEYHNAYYDPPDLSWTVIPHHPGTRPPRWFEVGEPDPNQMDMFSHPDYVPQRRLQPGEREEWYVVDPENQSGDWIDPEDRANWTPEEVEAWQNAGWFPRTDDVDFEDYMHLRGDDARTWMRELRPGPYATREEAEAAMERMLERAREQYEENFWESMYDDDAYHRIERDVLDDFINEHLDEYNFPRDDDEGDLVLQGPRYRGYKLPGGEHYGELVIREGEAGTGASRNYKSHFDDASNVGDNAIAHVRFSIRTDANGKRTLLVEEVQSDVHQQGREFGYEGDPPGLPRTWRVMSLADAPPFVHEQFKSARLYTPANLQPSHVVVGRNNVVRGYGDSAEEAVARAMQTVTRAPRAPLRDNLWAELVMKRVIKFAADHGIEQLAWVPGTVKNGRIYPLDAPPEGWQFYDNVLPNIVNRLVKKDGQRVGEAVIPELKQKDSQGAVSPFNVHTVQITPGLAKQYEEIPAYLLPFLALLLGDRLRQQDRRRERRA